MAESTFFVNIKHLHQHPSSVRFAINEHEDELAVLRSDILKRGMMAPVLVTPTGNGHDYWIVDGFRRVAAMDSLGYLTIACKLAPVITPNNAETIAGVDQDLKRRILAGLDAQLEDLKQTLDALEWGKKASKLHTFTAQDIADYCGIPRSTVLERIDFAKRFAHESINQRITMQNLRVENDLLKQKLTRRCENCSAVLNRHDRDLCYYCAKEHVRSKLCLEPGCKSRVPEQERPFTVSSYFCFKHGHDRNGIVHMPTLDRDGDPIWVTRELEVVKIRKMEDDHLTHTIAFLMDSAKKRCQVSGVDESKWELRAGPRFPFLKEEAMRRDEELKSCCVDGISSIEKFYDDATFRDVERHVLCSCKLGRDRLAVREAAEAMAKEHDGRKVSLSVLTVAIISMITAGMLPAGAHVVSWFVDYLRSLGVVK